MVIGSRMSCQAAKFFRKVGWEKERPIPDKCRRSPTLLWIQPQKSDLWFGSFLPSPALAGNTCRWATKREK